MARQRQAGRSVGEPEEERRRPVARLVGAPIAGTGADNGMRRRLEPVIGKTRQMPAYRMAERIERAVRDQSLRPVERGGEIEPPPIDDIGLKAPHLLRCRTANAAIIIEQAGIAHGGTLARDAAVEFLGKSRTR